MNQLNYRQIALDLAAYNVRYVLTGSLAAALYGVPPQGERQARLNLSLVTLGISVVISCHVEQLAIQISL
jgi:hypothetical protein